MKDVVLLSMESALSAGEQLPMAELTAELEPPRTVPHAPILSWMRYLPSAAWP